MKPRRIKRRLNVVVAFHHVDMLKVVHNAQYFKWFEQGRLALLEAFFPITFALENHVATPVVMNQCEYLNPATYGDELVVTTTHIVVDHWDGRFTFDHSISNRKTKVENCRGNTTVTVQDMKTGKLIKEIPKELWEKYRALK